MKILAAILGAILFPIGIFFGGLFLMYIGYTIWQRLTAIYEWVMEKLFSDDVFPVLVILVILMFVLVGARLGYLWGFGI